MDDYLLSVQQVAERLGKPNDTGYVYRLLNHGLMKYLKMGSKKVRNSELNRFLAEYEGKDISNPADVKDIVLNSNEI